MLVPNTPKCAVTWATLLYKARLMVVKFTGSIHSVKSTLNYFQSPFAHIPKTLVSKMVFQKFFFVQHYMLFFLLSLSFQLLFFFLFYLLSLVFLIKYYFCFHNNNKYVSFHPQNTSVMATKMHSRQTQSSSKSTTC